MTCWRATRRSISTCTKGNQPRTSCSVAGVVIARVDGHHRGRRRRRAGPRRRPRGDGDRRRLRRVAGAVARGGRGRGPLLSLPPRVLAFDGYQRRRTPGGVGPPFSRGLRDLRRAAAFDDRGLVEPAGRRRRRHRRRRDAAPGRVCPRRGRGGVLLSIRGAGSQHRSRNRRRRPSGADRFVADRRGGRRHPPGGGFRRT